MRPMVEGVGGVVSFAFVIFVLLVTLVLIVGVVLLVRALAGGGSAAGQPHSALRILEERYARGEIDRDEFLRRRDDLRG